MAVSELIMHIDMDAFFASIEQQVNPSLRGRPVIIGGRNNKYRSIICAASYEAKRMGVDNAMPSWKALRICPRAVFVPADTAKYVYTSNSIFALLKHFSPRVEKFSIDEFFLDVNGCRRSVGPPEEIARMIKRKIRDRFGITCSVGIAPTRLSAKMAAKLRKPDGLVVLGKDNALSILRDLPVQKICGIGRRLQERFNSLGIRTCGQLGEYPDGLLKEHFGVVGLWLKAACRAEDSGGIGCYADKDGPPKSVGHSQTLREATADGRYIREWIYLLSEMVGFRLRRKNLWGRTVCFTISDELTGGFSKRKTFYEPTYDGREIYRRCLRIAGLMGLKKICARVLGVSVSNLTRADPLYLFESQTRRDRLLKCVDRINRREGEWTVFPAALKGAVY